MPIVRPRMLMSRHSPYLLTIGFYALPQLQSGIGATLRSFRCSGS
jgi:hypothetical protein